MDGTPKRDASLPELFTGAQWRDLGTALELTPRQRQIARLICRGHTNARIAGQLGTSFDTIRMHTRALYRKLEVTSRVGVPVRLVLVHRGMAGR